MITLNFAYLANSPPEQLMDSYVNFDLTVR